MSQSTRIFGAHLSGITIGGTSFLAVCEKVTLKWDNDTQKATALKDAYEYPIGIRGKWQLSGTFFISTANTAGEGGPGGVLWTKALANAQVAVSLVDNTVTGGINTLSGNGLITECEQLIADNAQQIQVTIMGQGALASSIA